MLQASQSTQKKVPQNSITLYIPNRLDVFTAPFLYEDFENMIWEGTPLVLDFSKTQFIDSVGLSVLKQGFLRCKKKTVRLILLGVKPQIKGCMEAAQLFSIFKRKPTKLHGQHAARNQARPERLAVIAL